MLADDLLSQVAEDSFRALVPTCDDAIQVFADDSVITALNYRGEPLRSLRATLAVGNVAREAAGVNEFAALAEYAGIDQHVRIEPSLRRSRAS